MVTWTKAEKWHMYWTGFATLSVCGNVRRNDEQKRERQAPKDEERCQNCLRLAEAQHRRARA
ncbi:MAG: hypothetical protein ACOC0J_02130 [Myxococcota bacterium]